MKKLTAISLFIFWAAVIAILAAGLVFNQNNKKTDSPPQQVSQSQTVASKTFSLEEVAKHNSASDCWIVINSKAYNVSPYIDYHPGGKRSIASKCGQEATGLFAAIHSNFAWDLLQKYYVGDITSGAGEQLVSVADTLAQLKIPIAQSYPGAEIIDIKPKKNLYIAKLAYQGKLYEIHLDSGGKVLKQEIENDEFNWNFWDKDADDD